MKVGANRVETGWRRGPGELKFRAAGVGRRPAIRNEGAAGPSLQRKEGAV
jgi:hypothetical protein